MLLVFPNLYVTGTEDPEGDRTVQRFRVFDDGAWLAPYDTDAMCAAYVLDGYEDAHPRLRSASKLRPRMHWRIVDCDNPRHRPWDDWQHGLEVAREIARWLEPRPRIYVTRAGWRYVWRLDPPEEIGEELAFLVSLHARGVPVDFACADWTRLYRMPRATRDGDQLPFVGEGFEDGTR